MTVYQKFKQIGKLESFFKIYFPSILGLILTSVSSSGYGALGFTGLIGFTQASVRAFGRTRNKEQQWKHSSSGFHCNAVWA